MSRIGKASIVLELCCLFETFYTHFPATVYDYAVVVMKIQDFIQPFSVWLLILASTGLFGNRT